MLTRCPACQTLFRIRAETLRVAHGRVRCGRCGAEFNALDSLAEDPDDLTDAAAAARDAAEAPQTTAKAAAMVNGAPDASTATAPVAAAHPVEDFVGPLPEASGAAAAGESAGAAAGSPVIAPELIHSLLLEEAPRRGRAAPRLLAGLVSLLLLAALAGQWLYLQRVPLYGQPALRPVLERMCLWLGCELPLDRAPERIEVVERIVREHPRVPRALLVNLTFISRAEGRIAYPVLELRLADLSGNRVAGRRFAPADYLPAADNPAGGLPAGRPVHVTLELLAPRLEVVSFQFGFL
jgi:predicted Zn finger-like uncharacterized protein